MNILYNLYEAYNHQGLELPEEIAQKVEQENPLYFDCIDPAFDGIF